MTKLIVAFRNFAKALKMNGILRKLGLLKVIRWINICRILKTGIFFVVEKFILKQVARMHSLRRTKNINILKPTGYVTHQQFNIQQLYVLPTLYLCVLYLSENKQRLVPLTA